MRMTPAPGDLASSGDITRISDSVDGTRLKLGSTEAADDAIANVKELDEGQSKQITSLLDKVRATSNYCFFQNVNPIRLMISKNSFKASKLELRSLRL
jgi:hypothetical protein